MTDVASAADCPPLPYDNVANHPGIDCTGETDSSKAMQEVLTADAGNACVYIPRNCSLSIGTPLNPPSYTCLEGSSSATMTSTIDGAGFANALFYAQLANQGAVASTTLASAPAKGSHTLNVGSTANFAAGQEILLASNTRDNTAQQFTVQSVGADTLTVDDPIEFTFVANDPVETYDHATGVFIDGHGMTVTGSGGALFEMASCRHCTVANIEVPTTTVTSYVGSMDVSGRDNLWYRMDVNAGGTAVYGLAVESEVRTKAVDCTATNARIAGFWEATGASNEWSGDQAWNNGGFGLSLANSSTADTDGVAHGVVDSCDFYANGIAGVYAGGVTDEEISNGHFDDNAFDGIDVEDSNASVPCTGLRLDNVSLNSEANGLYVNVGAHDVSGTNLEANLDRTSAVNVIAGSSALTLHNFTSTDTALSGGHVVDVGAGDTVTLSHSLISKTQDNTGAWIALITDGAGARLNADDVTIELVGSPTGRTYAVFANGPSTIVLHQTRTIGSIGTGLYSVGVASNIDVKQGVDFSSCSAPCDTDSNVEWTGASL